MIRVGVAGWSYPDWEGVVYPRPKPKGFHALPYLARYLDVVEINSTFYGQPRNDYAARWAGLVEDRPDFRFLVKLHRDFTHERRGDDLSAEAKTFLAGIAPLTDSGRLQALLVQFPVTFRTKDEDGWLERLRAWFPDHLLCLEVRHVSWFEPDALERVGRLGFDLVHIDLPHAKNHPPGEHPTLGPLGYLRLHGRNRSTWFSPKSGRDARYDYRYTRPELEAIAERMRKIAAETQEAVLVANNHFAGQAVANALELKGLLSGAPVPAPEPLRRAFPELAVAREPGAQGSLW